MYYPLPSSSIVDLRTIWFCLCFIIIDLRGVCVTVTLINLTQVDNSAFQERQGPVTMADLRSVLGIQMTLLHVIVLLSYVHDRPIVDLRSTIENH